PRALPCCPGEPGPGLLARAVDEAGQVAGAAGQRVVEDEVVAGEVGLPVGFGGGGGADVGGVAAVAPGQPEVEGGGEGGEAFGHVQRGGGQQDAQGLRAVLGRGDDRDVLGPGLLVAAPGGAPRPVVGEFGPAEQGLRSEERRVGKEGWAWWSAGR